MSPYIKPTASFDNPQFEGEFTFVKQTADCIFLNNGTETFKVIKWTWNEALTRGEYIKVGPRCTRHSKPSDNPTTETRTPAKRIDLAGIQTTLLSNVPVNPALYVPIKTGTDIDRFWSRKHGVLPGTITMVTGDPGIGKSSVMMDVLQGIKTVNPDKKVLLVSAEMTMVDMLDPDEFMKYYPSLFDKVEFMFASDYIESEEGPTFTQALEVLLNRGYDLVVLDSMAEVQSLVQADLGLGSRMVAEKFILNLLQKHTNAQNERKVHSSFLMIQQVNKGGEFVGSRRLEHMITAFLSLKWDTENKGKKYMEFRKNRRGDVKKRLYFKLGNGVEYDMTKYDEEAELQNVLDSNKDVVEEMTQKELFEMLNRKNEETSKVVFEEGEED